MLIYLRKSMLFLLVHLTIFQTINAGHGVLYAKLISYVNKGGHDINGRLCDGEGNACDLVFEFCFSSVSSKVNCDLKLYTTDAYNDQNEVTFGSRIGYTRNPIKLIYSGNNIPRLVKLDIWVKDYDGDWHPKGLVDRLTKVVNVTFLTYNQGSTSSALTTLTSSNIWSSFKIEVYCICKPNFYGVGCSVQCIPTSKYRCNKSSGERICVKGWRGQDCSVVDYCTVNQPCSNGATCSYESIDSVTYQCFCAPGFEGDHCIEVIPPTTTTRVTTTTTTTNNSPESSPFHILSTNDDDTLSSGGYNIPFRYKTASPRNELRLTTSHVVAYIVAGGAFLILICIAVFLAFKVGKHRKVYKTAQMGGRQDNFLPPVAYRPAIDDPTAIAFNNPYQLEAAFSPSGTVTTYLDEEQYDEIGHPREESIYEDPDLAFNQEDQDEASQIFENPNYGNFVQM